MCCNTHRGEIERAPKSFTMAQMMERELELRRYELQVQREAAAKAEAIRAANARRVLAAATEVVKAAEQAQPVYVGGELVTA